jgi:putative alpha-1,2-mannosidase
MGIYPEIPGLGGFTIGTPLFSKVTLRLGNGRSLEIARQGEGVYVHSVTVNGVPHASSWLALSALSQPTNRIEFQMQPEPDHSWATQPADFPPSFDSK